MEREAFLNLAREIPIFGGLVDCELRDHWESLGQTSVLFVLSVMPIWLGTLIVYANGSVAGYPGFRLALKSTISNGELFMYSTAFLAPIFWIALSDKPNLHNFPGRVSHIVLMVIISVIAAVFFGLLTAHDRIRPTFTFWLSAVMFLMSLVLLYLGILYHESRIPDAGETMKTGESRFVAKLREHRNES